MNYTKEQTIRIVSHYEAEPTASTVAKLAEEMGKSTKSIIGKLSREGVYQRSVYVTKSGQAPITKLELVSLIAGNLNLDDRRHLLEGLEKAPKQVLFLIENMTAKPLP
jgi:hypothetical protein|tara:strand:- start:125 stop:448 length:324 start_codon:yes stop_codon:yes gene_type:complete